MRALIAEPRVDEAIRLAAFLREDGYEVVVFSGTDLIAEVAQLQPDVLLLRHERPAGQSGLAMVSRLKMSAARTLIILTTNELTFDAIERSRQQRYHADAFLRLPVERADLLAAVRIVPSSPSSWPAFPDAAPSNAPAAAESVSAAGMSGDGAASELSGPLPAAADASVVAAPRAPGTPSVDDDETARAHGGSAAPAGHGSSSSVAAAAASVPPTRVGTGLPRSAPRAGSDGGVNAEDIAFVERVFAAIQHTDPEASTLEPQPSSVADPTERKVALLRSELRRREREIARLSRVWRVRDEDVRQKEARFAQKEIELEALRLRAQELDAALAEARQQLLEREAALGRLVSELFDAGSYAQAELIQQVAAQESAVHAAREAMRRAEDMWNLERVAQAAQAAEREEAHAGFEAHHWRVAASGLAEIERLEEQVRAREQAHGDTRGRLRDRELDLEVARAKIATLERHLREVEHAAAVAEADALARAHGVVLHERRARLEQREETEWLRARVFELEEDLAHGERLLVLQQRERRQEIGRLAVMIRSADADRARLLGERAMWMERVRAWEAASSENSALAEATAHQLFQLEEKRRIVAGVQLAVRDAKLADLLEEVARLSAGLAGVTERLGKSEMDHAAEQARAEDLERALAESAEAQRASEELLTQRMAVVIAERDKLVEGLARAEQRLASTRADLADARASREQREVEIAAVLEQRDAEMAMRADKLVEVDRALSLAREDLHNARKTVAVRDERITELLARVRAADEQNVALEARNFRLVTDGAERETELQARDERIAGLQDRLARSDGDNTRLELELKRAQASLAEKAGAVERQEVQLHTLQAELQRHREEIARFEHELAARAEELAQAASRGAALEVNLQSARAELEAGEAVAEQLRAQGAASEHRAAELRRALEESESRLRQSQTELQASTQRSAQLDNEIGDARARAAAHEQDLELARAQLESLTKQRAALEEQVDRLQATLASDRRARQLLEGSVAERARENSELAATLADARAHTEELEEHARSLERTLGERDAQLSHVGELLEQAKARSRALVSDVEAHGAEAAELRQRLEEAMTGIEERARWLQTREATIAELKAALEMEQTARGDVASQLDVAMERGARLQQESDALRARLHESEQVRTSEVHRASLEAQALAARAERAEGLVRELQVAADQATREANSLRVEAQRAAELQHSEEKARADAQSMRQLAERAAREVKAVRAAQERAEAELARLRAELEGARAAHKASEQLVLQARQEGEQRTMRLRELEQQQQRLQAAREALERRAEDAERDAASARGQGAQEAQAERRALEEQLHRLQGEMVASKKARADALALAQQAKTEAEQIKRLAAEKIKQAQAAARSSVPPRPARPSEPPAAAAPSVTAVPALVAPVASADPLGPMPTVVVHASDEGAQHSVTREISLGATRPASPAAEGSGVVPPVVEAASSDEQDAFGGEKTVAVSSVRPVPGGPERRS